MPDYSEWVSTLALGLSGTSLGWQMIRARHDQPVITVDGQWSVQRGRSSGAWDAYNWVFPIHVTNAGGRAVTVTEVGWELKGPMGWVLVRSREAGTELPTRIEALSAEYWEVHAAVEGTQWEGLAARPVARVVLGRKGVVPVYGSTVVLPGPPPD